MTNVVQSGEKQLEAAGQAVAVRGDDADERVEDGGSAEAESWWRSWRRASPVLLVVIPFLALMWQVQASSNGQRQEIGGLRQEMRQEIGGLRQEIGGLRQELVGIRATQLEMVERLSRIEGFLGIGMPDEVADQAPGAGFADSSGGGE